MSAAAEIYQWLIEEALVGLEGIRNISDNIIIRGKDKDELPGLKLCYTKTERKEPYIKTK